MRKTFFLEETFSNNNHKSVKERNSFVNKRKKKKSEFLLFLKLYFLSFLKLLEVKSLSRVTDSFCSPHRQ